MANWFYFNKSGEKVGPISTATLKEIAAQGVISPETKIENHTGRTVVAGRVNGLTFPEPTKVPAVPVKQAPPFVAAPPMDSNPFVAQMPKSQPTAQPVPLTKEEENQRNRRACATFTFALTAIGVTLGLVYLPTITQPLLVLGVAGAASFVTWRKMTK